MGKPRGEAQDARRAGSCAVHVITVADGFQAVVWPDMVRRSFVFVKHADARRAGGHMAEARRCALVDHAGGAHG